MADPKLITVLDELRYWTTLGGACWTVWKVYSYLKHNVNAWADKLLNNHLAHVQESLDDLCAANAEQVELLKKIVEK